MPPRRLSDDELQSLVRDAIDAARDFVEAEVAPARIQAQSYYAGDCDLETEIGRSAVVATKVRDTIRAVKPVLMRVFLQTDKPVEFIPRSPQAVVAARQATAYASYVFTANNGFTLLSDAFDDALIAKVGVIKAYLDETPEVTVDEYSGLTPEYLPFFEGDPDLEVLEAEEGEDGTLDLRVAKTTRKGRIKLKGIAPENFFIDASATTLDDATCCGHAEPSVVGDVVAMGFDFDQVVELAGEDDDDDAERFERVGHEDEDDRPADPSLWPILFTEAYIRMDREGTGVPRLYKVLCAGEDHTILRDEGGELAIEPADMNPFAAFEANPLAHSFFGPSLAELLIADQDAATSLLRGLLDSIAFANNPRIAFDPNLVNTEDVMNGEIGGIIRTKGAPAGALQEITMGLAAQSTLPAIAYYDEQIRAKTGVMGAGMGMDADALQSQTKAGVNAAVQAAQAQSELIARHLAEGGMRQLFDKIAALARQHPDPDGMIRVDGEFVAVDPRSWTAPMDVITNVGLGTGRHEERLMALQQTLQVQTGILQTQGPDNPLVGISEFRATLADILALAGIHNADRHFKPMTPQIEQQLKMQRQQAAQGQPKPMDPAQAVIQGETIKAQQRMASDQAKLQAQMIEARADDDLERDKMRQGLFVELLKLGQKDSQQRMQADMAAPRAYGGATAAPQGQPMPQGEAQQPPPQRPPMAPQRPPMGQPMPGPRRPL